MKSQSSFSRLQITEDAKASLARQATRHQVSQTELASRLIVWLVKQPTAIQATVLNNIDAGIQEQLSDMLQSAAERRSTAKPTRKPTSLKPATRTRKTR